MTRFLREFKIGRPQIFAGTLLLVFLIECLWVAAARRLSDLEFEYIALGIGAPQAHASQTQASQARASQTEALPAMSPLTGLIAALPVHLVGGIKAIAPASIRATLAIPRPWVFRLPFVIFGLSLGAAIWWVARRLFGNPGGYVALSLYCFSPAMVKISANIGPEIILAWSSFGLLYTAIGVAHTVYAPPRKWIPRIVILGIAIGICLSTALWSLSIVLLALAFMLYLSPGRRRAVLTVLAGGCTIAVAILAVVGWLAGGAAVLKTSIIPRATMELVRNLGFAFADSDHYLYLDYVVPVLLVMALMVYGSWGRARYFGNTAPLITSFGTVFLFALVPGNHLWEASLGLSFLFLFIAGVAADLLESHYQKSLSLALSAILAVKGVLGLSLLRGWIHQNPM